MVSPLSRADVVHVAGLARLELSEPELDTFARQLADILAYAAVVQQADTTGVDADAGASPAPRQPPVTREDAPAPSIDRDAIIAQAPGAAPDAGLFRVPKVL